LRMAEVKLDPEAQREYSKAVRWYQQRSASAARRFAAEVDRALTDIAAQPDRFGWYDNEFREVGLRRYPYSLIYRVDSGGDALVVAVAHTSREPGYWEDRS